MNELYKIQPDCALCRKCHYYRHQNESYGCCDYIGIEGHSRTFDEKGKRRLEKGTCDKFKPKHLKKG